MVIIKEEIKLEHQNTEANRALFSAWVTDPANVRFADSEQIGSMAEKFPYCQIIQSFRAKAAHKQPEQIFNPLLFKASLYSPDRKVLFTLVNHPENLKPVSIAPSAQEETYYEVIGEDDYAADLVEQEPEELVFEPGETNTGTDNVPEIVILEGEEISFQGREQDIISESAEAELTVQEIAGNSSWNEEEKMIIENIAAADFFAFEEKLDSIQGELSKETSATDGEAENVETRSVIDPEEIAETSDSVESQVARYDDDSMPYSFLWWLHKTRNEHADTYQPYVEFRLDTNRKIKKADNEDLNQQIIENIFHLQSPLADIETNAPQTVHFEVKRKEEEIIEKFIREEPQIHPPSPDKLDMENKARKSAEDPNDLVSETLASIYTEQMLFHKAIDTYQKLSLKFPEKRAYFADQISELQKKIN